MRTATKRERPFAPDDRRVLLVERTRKPFIDTVLRDGEKPASRRS
jgi:hypothetical protein